LLRETILNISFQLILDRISKGVHDKVSRGSDLTQALFNFAYKYKCVWTKRGFDTPLMNRYIFFSSPILEHFFSSGMYKISKINFKYKIQEKSMAAFLSFSAQCMCSHRL
jgi:hypothetical protein